jgi:hypothetical protein
METINSATSIRVPWNKGKLVGQKAPLKLKEIWSLRVRLQIASRSRELALFNLAVDKGPMQELNGREAVLTSSKRIFPLLERFEVRAQFVSGDRAMFAYDFVCRDPIGVCRTAELVRFQDGLIRDIELFFDARPFEAMQRTQADRATPK